MASTEIDTTTLAGTTTHGRTLAQAGTRLYAIYNDGTNTDYEYSDDNGATWTGATTVRTGANRVGVAFYDAVNGRMNFVTAAENDHGASLRYRAITSNVTSGTPGALSTEVTIDAGGTNLGVQFPSAFHSATGTNPRYWIIAKKSTTASTQETRAWSVNVTTVTDADTAGNWLTTNFTDLGGNSNASSAHFGMGVWWTISASERVTFVFEDGNNNGTFVAFEAVTFDPTAGTPTPGTVTVISAAELADTWAARDTDGAPMALNATADYLVFGRLSGETAAAWDFFKTVDGTTWTEPSGWTGLTMGRAQIARSGSDFYLVHSASYGALATTAQALLSRKITTSSDAMGSTTAFSDTNGNTVSVLLDTGTDTLFSMYRGSTGSPYTIRSDTADISEEPPVGDTVFKRLYGPAQLTGSAADLYTCPASTKTRVLHVHASNPSASPVDVNLSIGADAAATRVWDDLAVGADRTKDDYTDYTLAAGEKIQGWADSAATVTLTISGIEVPA